MNGSRHGRMTVAALAVWLVLGVGEPTLARADRVSIPAARDATLIEDPTGSLANGAGPHLFVGRTGQRTGSVRRALLAFDVAGHVPRGARILSASVTLRASPGNEGAAAVHLHRVLAPWGEGSSQASGGRGAPAERGDATWLHTFWPDVLWATPGGDFASAPASSTSVAGEGPYAWPSTAQTVADVQLWLDSPSSNRGWLLRGDEAMPSTSRKLDSRDHPDPARRPALVVDFERRDSACRDAGLDDPAWALCHAYCEELDCDTETTRASARACRRLEAGFHRRTDGAVLPCELPDTDADGVPDADDLCPTVPDAGQEDADGDGVGDACDNCVDEPNPGQEDTFGDQRGDVCDCPCFVGEDVATLLAALSDPEVYTPLVCIDTRSSSKPLTAVQAFRIDGSDCAEQTPDCSALAFRFTEDAVCQWNPPAPSPSVGVQGIGDAQREACRESILDAAALLDLSCN